jgi:hypothetical protein
VTTVLIADSALIDYRDALAALEAERISTGPATNLLIDALRHVAAFYTLAPPERPGSAWRSMSLADDEIAPRLVIHLRVGDAGDLDLLVDQALIVLNLRLERALDPWRSPAYPAGEREPRDIVGRST